jgi:hypothetical protein
MKRIVIGHILTWASIVSVDVSGYIPVWKNRMILTAAVNYSWLLLVFYICYAAALKFYNRERQFTSIALYWEFWTVIMAAFIYVTGTMITDKYFLHVYFAPTALSYSTMRLMMALPFMGAAVFLAGLQTRAIQFYNIREERNYLLVELRRLRTETEQIAVDKEKLLKDNNLLQFERIANHEKIAELSRDFDRRLNYYEDIIRRLKNGEDDRFL